MPTRGVVHKILIIGPAWVGDIVMAQSLFKCLSAPVIIDVLAPAWASALLMRMPEVRRVITLPFQHGELNVLGRYRLAKTLRAEQYDQAIVLPNSFKSALIPYWANIPIRTGWRGEWRYGVLNDCRILDKQALPLMIQRFCALAQKSIASSTLPYPALQINPVDTKTIAEKHKLSLSRPVLALCPGAAFGPAKAWPAEYYGEVAVKKIQAGYNVWIIGSEKEQAAAKIICHAVREAEATTVHAQTQPLLSGVPDDHSAAHSVEMSAGCVDLTGNTPLSEAIDLLSLADYVVTNDSGLMHIAAALGRKLVVIYGSSSMHFTPPLVQNQSNVRCLTLNLPCQPCFQRTCPLEHLKCLRDLKPTHVLAALDVLQGFFTPQTAGEFTGEFADKSASEFADKFASELADKFASELASEPAGSSKQSPGDTSVMPS